MEILTNAIIKAAGWSIIHSLWQGAIIYAVLLLLFVLKPKLTAKTRHNLAFIALCGICVWFLITFYNELSLRLYIANNPAIIGTYSSITSVAANNPIKLPAFLLYKAEQNMPFIVFIYSMGLMMQIVYLAFGYHRMQHIKTRGLSDLDPAMNSHFMTLLSKINISRTVTFKLSSIVSVPMVIGYFKPVVLLPLSVLAQMNQDQLEAIIVHELSHIRRNDYLLNILKISIETILFFNPFVWLSARVIDTERENACDDLVLKITGSPLSYAQTLLQLEKIKSEQQVFALAATGKKYHLLNRIKRITTMKTNNSNLKQTLFGIFLIVVAVASISWINIKKDKQVLPKAPKTELEGLKRSKAGLMEKAHALNFNEARFDIRTDTTKKKIKIVITDEKGNVREYNNIKDMPQELRADFMMQSIFPTMPVIPPMPPMPPMVDTGFLAAVTKMYNTPEFRKKMEDIQLSQMTDENWKRFSENIAKQFSGPEWKAQMEGMKLQFDSPEWKAKMEDFQKQFNSQEWKVKMQDFEKQFDSKAWQKQNEQLEKMFNSPEWKAKMQDFEKQFESKEWKEYFEKMKNLFPDDKHGKIIDNADKKPNN